MARATKADKLSNFDFFIKIRFGDILYDKN